MPTLLQALTLSLLFHLNLRVVETGHLAIIPLFESWKCLVGYSLQVSQASSYPVIR